MADAAIPPPPTGYTLTPPPPSALPVNGPEPDPVPPPPAGYELAPASQPWLSRRLDQMRTGLAGGNQQAIDTVKGIGHAALHPIDTIDKFGETVANAIKHPIDTAVKVGSSVAQAGAKLMQPTDLSSDEDIRWAGARGFDVGSTVSGLAGPAKAVSRKVSEMVLPDVEKATAKAAAAAPSTSAARKNIEAASYGRREAINAELHANVTDIESKRAAAQAEAKERLQEGLLKARADEYAAKQAAELRASEGIADQRSVAQTGIKPARADQRAAQGWLGAVGDTDAAHRAARGTARLPAPDTPGPNDLGSRVREKAIESEGAAAGYQSEEGGKAWDTYEKRAGELEDAGDFFTTSPGGAKLMETLTQIERGYAAGSKMTDFGPRLRSIAGKVRNALAGVEDASEARLPVSMKVVDDQLRELRKIESNKMAQGAEAIERDNARRLADDLEKALKGWVGDEHYPRSRYADVSRELNKWQTPLSDALTGAHSMDYQGTIAPRFKVPSKDLPKRIFASRESIAEARDLLGEGNLNEFAQQHIANELAGKSSDEIAKWAQANQDWLHDGAVPGARNSVLEYQRVLAEREGSAAALKKVADARAAQIKDVRAQVKAAVKGVRADRERALKEATTQRGKAEGAAAKGYEGRVGEANTAADKAIEEVKGRSKEQFSTLQKDLEARNAAVRKLEDFLSNIPAKQAVARFEKEIEPLLSGGYTDRPVYENGRLVGSETVPDFKPEDIARAKQELAALDQAATTAERRAKIMKALKYVGIVGASGYGTYHVYGAATN